MEVGVSAQTQQPRLFGASLVQPVVAVARLRLHCLVAQRHAPLLRHKIPPLPLPACKQQPLAPRQQPWPTGQTESTWSDTTMRTHPATPTNRSHETECRHQTLTEGSGRPDQVQQSDWRFEMPQLWCCMRAGNGVPATKSVTTQGYTHWSRELRTCATLTASTASSAAASEPLRRLYL